MTIKELYQYAYEHNLENHEIIVAVPLTSEYEEKVLDANDIMVCSECDNRFFKTEKSVRLMG